MSYCRFGNTLIDLRDCYDHMDEIDELSDEEAKARRAIIEMCCNIAEDHGDELEE